MMVMIIIMKQRPLHCLRDALVIIVRVTLDDIILFDTMQVHVVNNVKRKDEKYWLPGQPEEAYFCVRVCMEE